jgi:hypothetical protein
MIHVELFKNGFDSTITEKIKPENWPYVGYDMVTGEIVYTVIPEPQPNNEIWYTTNDESIMYIDESYCNYLLGVDFKSNTYKDNKGIIEFSDTLVKLAGGAGMPGSDWSGVSYSVFGSPDYDTNKVKTISIPSSVQYIRGNAFRGLSISEKFNFNGTLENWCNIEFDNSIFWENNEWGGKCYPETIHPSQHILEGGIFTINNEEIVDLVIPDSITNLKGYNFYGLKSIKTLDLKNVQSIGDSTFAGCTGLTTIHIPESVISVGNNAFAVGYIQKSNFVNDSILDAADNNYWGATVYDYKSEEGLYCNNNYTIKYTGENNTTINIPEGVTVIDTNTFGKGGGSYSYLTINLPSTITTLKECSIGGIEFITVNYNGTKEQWNAITKEDEWSAWSCAGDYNDFGDNSKFTIHCTDGDVTVDGRWWA